MIREMNVCGLVVRSGILEFVGWSIILIVTLFLDKRRF